MHAEAAIKCNNRPIRASVHFVRTVAFNISLILLLVNPGMVAQDAVHIGEITDQVEFDGLPFEEAWEKASHFPLVVSSPNFGTEPSEYSEVMVAYDQQFLWVGARLFSEEPVYLLNAGVKADNLKASRKGLSQRDANVAKPNDTYYSFIQIIFHRLNPSRV